MDQTIETTISYITIIESGIVRVQSKPDTHIELEHLEENLRAYSPILKGEKGLFLVVFEPGGTISKEARETFEKRHRNSFKLAEAFVVHSLGHRIMANFHVRINESSHPIKVFRGEEEAIEWLKTFLDQ